MQVEAEAEMMLQVQYRNYRFDYITVQTFDRLLAADAIRYFYRPSERKWIDVYFDPIRGSGGRYSGPDRRHRNKLSLVL